MWCDVVGCQRSPCRHGVAWLLVLLVAARPTSAATVTVAQPGGRRATSLATLLGVPLAARTLARLALVLGAPLPPMQQAAGLGTPAGLGWTTGRAVRLGAALAVRTAGGGRAPGLGAPLPPL